MNLASEIELRDSPTTADEFLQLIQDPFKSAFQVNAVWVSLGSSLGISVFLTFLFSVVRPRHSLVYAPKVKHVDLKHAPPPVGKGVFSWVKPVWQIGEPALVDCIGLDATIFVRFTKMCRNIFVVLTLIGCLVMIPVNISQSQGNSAVSGLSAFTIMTPLYVPVNAIWSQVACAWVLDITVAFFLWRNYKEVLKLRRRFFESSDYQRSLHARTLMITDIPQPKRSNEGILHLIDSVSSGAAIPRATAGRNVKDLPRLIAEYEKAVRRLESILSKYLKRPNQLPARRPTMHPYREDKGEYDDGKVDAISYLTEKIQKLEEEIRHVRASIDKRSAMSYGFASWERIEDAHTVAYATRNKHPSGTSIRLAPWPNDIIWENLSLSKGARRWKRFLNVIWVSILTVVWIAPNAMIAIFLSNLSNLGQFWPTFQTSLNASPHVWAAVQGIASPAITSLVYLVLPIIFRRLSMHAGDTSRTSRERHVFSNLYSFFTFNNLVAFSLFSSAWAFVAAVINANTHTGNAWEAIQEGDLYSKAVSALCNVSPFWVTWLLQRNLGAAIDLVQLVTLTWVWFSKTFLSPTPRQAIEWTAPPWFDYASYYNYFLFYATVAFCFATIQPIVLPVTALYFVMDVLLKKYLLMYVFVTKTESGGCFWRVLFNRMVFATILANVIHALVAKVKGTWAMVFCVVPLPFLMLALKFYCVRVFDPEILYYSRVRQGDSELFAVGKPVAVASERLSTKFGHPALYKPLITPMVHAKAAEVLKQIYRGRLSSADMTGEYSDIMLGPMSNHQPGKSAYSGTTPFEVIPENQLDFSYFKDRPDFRDEFGGGIYGRPEDLITERSQTPYSVMSSNLSSGLSRAPSPAPSLPQISGLKVYDVYGGVGSQIYPVPSRPPLSRQGSSVTDGSPFEHDSESEVGLLRAAQMPGQSEVTRALGRRRNGYGQVDQDEDGGDFISYERYRMPQ